MLFVVDQRQFGIRYALGQIKEVITEPGLNFKIPMIQNVRYFDRRILTLDNNDPERFITSEKKNVLVDSFVKWRIVDPKLYYISVGGYGRGHAGLPFLRSDSPSRLRQCA